MTDVLPFLFPDTGQSVASAGPRLRNAERDGQRWYAAADIAQITGRSSAAHAVSRLSADSVRSLPIWTAGGRQMMTCVDERALKWLLARSKTAAAVELAQQFEVDILWAPSTSDSTLKIIVAALVHLPQEPERPVGPYRIDLYLPTLNIAVECDELDHTRYDASEEAERQAFIERALGCRFIRYNPQAAGFNVGSVINRILVEQGALFGIEGGAA